MDIPLEGKFRFLIVDDELHLRKVICARLRMGGFDAEAVGNGQEAIKYLQEHYIDVVLLDVHIPGMDGGQVLMEIRQLPQGKNLPVYILTADSSPETVNRFLTQDLQGYFLKPVDFHKLQDFVWAQDHQLHNRRFQLYLQTFFDRFNDPATDENYKRLLVSNIFNSRFFREFFTSSAFISDEERNRLYAIMQQFFKGLDRMMLERLDISDEETAMETLKFMEGFMSPATETGIAAPLKRIIEKGGERTSAKAAKILGKVSDDLVLLRHFLLSRNSRFVANMLEGLWGNPKEEVLRLFLGFLPSPNSRIRANCIVGLYLNGKTDVALEALTKMLAQENDPGMRRSAIWAAGHLKLVQLPAPGVQGFSDIELPEVAARILQKLSAI